MYNLMFIASASQLSANSEGYLLPCRSAPPHKKLW